MTGRIDVYVGSVPPESSDWPDSTNTGVPAGTSLTPSGSVTTSANNQIIDALDITNGHIIVNHTGVLIKRCRIKQVDEPYLVYPNATGLIVQDCEMDGDVSGTTGISVENGVTYIRCDIHDCENGGNVGANSSGNPALIQDSWFHDLAPEGSGFHTDGLQFDSDASYLTIEHCHFQPIPSGIRNATSCINLGNEVGFTNNHITINNNLIDGRGCGSAVYLPRYSGWSNIAVTSNRILSGDNGYCDGGNAATYPGGGVTTFTGNVDHLTGAALAVSD